MKGLERSRVPFVAATLCLVIVTACTRRTSVARPIDTAAATATPTADGRVHTTPPDAAVATATPSPPNDPAGGDLAGGQIGELELAGYLGSGPIRALAVHRDLAYVGQSRMLALVDLHDPARPQRAGYSVLPDKALDVAVVGPSSLLSGQAYAYVALGQGGLAVVDVSDPAHPIVIGTHDLSSRVTAVAADGAYLYVSAGALRILDLTDPSTPVEIGAYHVTHPTGDAGKVVAVSDETAYLVYHGGSSQTGGLRIVDVSDPAAPSETGAYRAGVPVRDAAIAGDHAYLLVGQGIPHLVVVDLSDFTQPVAVGPAGAKPWLGQSLAVAGHILALVSPGDPGTLTILDVSDAAHPVLLGQVTDVPLPVTEIVARDSQVILAANNALVIVDLSDPIAPRVTASDGPQGLPAVGRAIAVAGDTATIAAGRDGLWVVDVSDPANPRVVGSLDTAGHAWDVAIRDGTAYVADEHNGLRVVDVHDPAHPVEVGGYNAPGTPTFFGDVAIGDVATGDGRSSKRVYAYVADALPGDTSLRVIDVTDPAVPKQVSRLPLGTGIQGDVRAYGVALSGNIAYVALGAAGLRVVDVSDPLAPIEVGALDVPGRADSLVVAGDIVALVDGDLRIVDVLDPASPREIGFYDVPDLSPWPHVAVEGRYLYLAAQGTRVLDGSNAAALVEVAVYPAATGAVAAANGLIYVLGEGLTILSPREPVRQIPLPTLTSKSECGVHTASMSLRATHTHPYIGDTITVTVQLTNQGCGMLGMPKYSLHVETEGEQPVFEAMPEPAVHYVGLAAGQSDTIEFVLRTITSGRAALTAAASFEFHGGSPGPGTWGSASTGVLQIIVLEPEPELVPKGGQACFVAPEVPIEVCLPRGTSISRHVQQNRLGSLVAYRLVPVDRGEVPRLAELLFSTEASIEQFVESRAQGRRDGPRFLGDTPDLEQYHRRKMAVDGLEPLVGYERLMFNGRAYLVTNRACAGEPCVIRAYTTFVRDIKLDVWVVLDDASQEKESDRLFAHLTVFDTEVDL